MRSTAFLQKAIFDVATCLKSSGGIEKFGERDYARLAEADAINRVPTDYRIIFSWLERPDRVWVVWLRSVSDLCGAC